jgi:mono/diheme cytochrome c family protein
VRAVRALLCSLLAIVALGCEDAPTRVWQPSDHAHPPETLADPTRAAPRDRMRGDDRVDPAATRARAAAALWRVSCARCHGPDGRGGGPELPPGAQPPDMTRPEWQRDHTDEELADAIRNGRGVMPSFGDQVSPAGVAALVEHVRTLAPQQ